MPFYTLLVLLFTSTLNNAFALPIDWNGAFGVDSTLIDSYRRVERTTQGTANSGSQEVNLASGSHANASFQSYLFRLNPVIVINDSASLKGEITSGYGRGGRLGDSSTESKQGNFGNALYMYNTSNESSTLILNKFYMELYADTATYQIGRHSSHWGLGAIVNAGDKVWDRHTYTRDGITMNVKIGNFHISPYWAKISSENSLTRATNAKEYGFSLLYDNIERDLSFGLLYGIKKNNAFNSSIEGIDSNGATTTLGKTDVKFIDLYLKKSFGKFTAALEAPITNGEIGNLYNRTDVAKYKSKAIVIETDYKFSNSWNVGFDLGKVDGHSSSLSSFNAMYLNPNYQIANLLFRYNLHAVSSPDNKNIYDSYITNATYFKLAGEYSTEKWTWDAALIYAIADETAKSGERAFNHETNTSFQATDDQSDKLGLEVDLGFNYFWNKDITIGGSAGYLFTGDYYKFTNNASSPNDVKNSYALQVRTAVLF